MVQLPFIRQNEAGNAHIDSFKPAQQSMHVLSKWPSIRSKWSQNSTSTEQCFGWGWNLRHASPRRVPNDSTNAQPSRKIAETSTQNSLSVGIEIVPPKAASRSPNGLTQAQHSPQMDQQTQHSLQRSSIIKRETDPNFNLNGTMRPLGLKFYPRKLPTDSQMAQQKRNIAPKWANKGPKESPMAQQKTDTDHNFNPNGTIRPLGLKFYPRKLPTGSQMAQQKRNIAPKWANKGPKESPMAQQKTDTDHKFNPNGTIRPLGLNFYPQRPPTDPQMAHHSFKMAYQRPK